LTAYDMPTNNGFSHSPFRHRDFRIFWTGSFISSIGTQFTTVAMAWQIYDLTHSPFQIGLLGLARALPQIFLLLFAGLLADAMNRRKLMMCTQMGLFCVSATLALLTFTGKASPQLLYVATMLLALFSSLEQPSRQSLIPNLVPRQDLAQALALQGTQRHVPMILGPSLAGIVLAISGPAACYTVDALSWLAMLSALLLLKTKISQGGGLRTVSLRSLQEGIGFVWGNGIILPLMLLDFGASFFGNVRGLLPIYAQDILSVGPTGLGVLYSARAVGSLSAAAAMTFWGPVKRSGLWVFFGVGIYGLATVLFAYSGLFWFSVVMLTMTGVGDTISSILRATINQLNTPDGLRGRMSSINSIFTMSGPQLGQFEIGIIATWLGTEMAALTGGLACLAILLAVAATFPYVRRFRIQAELAS
jgi:MFS family permease